MPSAARYYVGVIILIGLPVLFFSAYQFLPSFSRGWLYLAIATVLASIFPARLPVPLKKAGSFSISVGDCFIFAGFLLYGPAAAVLIAALEAAVTYLKVPPFRWERFLFNVSQLSLVAFLVAHAFFLFLGMMAPLDERSVSVPLLLVLLGCALLYGLLNTGIISVAMALVSGRHFSALIKTNFMRLSPTNLLNASAGLLLFLYFEPAEISMAVALIFLIVSAFYARDVSLAD